MSSLTTCTKTVKSFSILNKEIDNSLNNKVTSKTDHFTNILKALHQDSSNLGSFDASLQFQKTPDLRCLLIDYKQSVAFKIKMFKQNMYQHARVK